MVRKIDIDEYAHALKILQRLDRMKQDQRQCDFIVSVDGDEFHTHRNILSAGSEYFDAMLTHDTKESQLGKVEMMEVDSECVKICINYIYTGKAEIPDGKILALMHVASLMQLDELFKGIVTFFKNELNTDTFYETKGVAELYGLKNLLAKCKKIADDDFQLISSQPEFLDQPKKFMFDTISSKNLSATEKEKLIALLKWTRHDPERAKDLTDLMQTINLKDVPLSYRRHLIENESLITRNPQILQMISISVMDSVEIPRRNEKKNFDKKGMIIFDEKRDGLQSFNIQNEKMKKFHDEGVKRFTSFSAVSLRSHIYVLLSDKSMHRLNIADEKAKWEKMANMTECHGFRPPVVSHDGFLYVIGGQGLCCTAVSEQYFPDEDSWVRLKDLPNKIEHAALVSLDEYIYNAGGFRDGRGLDTFLRFSPSKSEWTHLPPMMKAKRRCGVAAVNQRIYLMGGYDGITYCTEVDCFDVITSQWMSLTPMTESRSSFRAICIDNLIYAFGGLSGDGEGDRLIEKYDIQRDSWTKVKIRGSTPEIRDAVVL